MRRRAANQLIRLGYLICPSLRVELQHAVEQIACAAADLAADQAAHRTIDRLLAYQQRAAQAASRQ